MFQLIAGKILHCISIPVLLLASLFSHSAASYELHVDFVIWLAAILVVQRAVRCRQYVYVMEGIAAVLAFSPLSLVTKMFLGVGFLCIAASVIFLSTLRMQTAIAE